MKRRRLSKGLLVPFILFFMLLALPKSVTLKIKDFASSVANPIWSLLVPLKPTLSQQEIEKLKLQEENVYLKNEVQKLKTILSHEVKILKQLSSKNEGNDSPRGIILEKKIEEALSSIPAKVLFRSPNSWGSSIWVDVGEEDNKAFKKPVICRNSPVVSGEALVGVIDYVGNRQSRVRLITDAGLSPSVRVARGELKKQMLFNLLSGFSAILLSKEWPDDSDQSELAKSIKTIKDAIGKEVSKNTLLAKGIINGRSLPLWRSPGQKLKGFGFNYDFSDEEGEALDLFNGRLIDEPTALANGSIVEAGDLLITTGYDGVFPANLKVGIVDHVSKLKEGDYFYEISAIPSAFDLDHLDLVFVLPPQGFDPEDLPPLIGR
ncbi:rod shape-determining protein MreC [Criblamydia sequanensis]|uniref:Cell shape-determining protein MreC n=1 Tax=Candidatus Criblamydia sequanensis CRIB-18 TaxID=1437425 RepID=A0A090D2L9_9BACT|nr:rod shape-determining protein MreC [Criblamydia sequanensis]CDR34493.1 Putative rod shape-determining protein MreC [Criblamydia sequanensis CRIB-18]